MRRWIQFTGMTCAILAITAMVRAQTQQSERNRPSESHYFYYKQPIELKPIPDRILFKVRPGSHIESIACLQRADVSVAPWSSDPHCFEIRIDAPGVSVSVPDLIVQLATDPAVRLASPIFEPPGFGVVIPTSDVLVGLAAETAPADGEAIFKATCPRATLERDWSGMTGIYRLRNVDASGAAVLAAANQLAQMDAFAFAEPDMISTSREDLSPNDPFRDLEWFIDNRGQDLLFDGNPSTPDVDMQVREAWDFTTGDTSTIVVVLDSGVQLDHPDLIVSMGNDLTGAGSAGGPGNDCESHGTAVAGIIRATADNGIGLAGVAPSVQLASARFTTANTTLCDGSGNFLFSDFVAALDWAQVIGARVTNVSYSFGSPSATIDAKYASTRANGLIHFASAGNNNGGAVSYPASLPTVSAINAIDRFGSLSYNSVGPQIAFTAPGDFIVTTDRTADLGYVDGDYVYFGGTSGASACAAAVAALVIASDPALTPDGIEAAMQSGARDLGAPGFDQQFGWGLIRACESLQAGSDVIYVNDNAVGANNGTSWADAFNHLQDALSVADFGDRVWVAAGTYHPDRTMAVPLGTGDRSAAFQLETGVYLYGGFSGVEASPCAADPDAHPTILSGDLAGDDDADAFSDNSLHVVSANDVESTAILNGFIVQGGRATGLFGNDRVGGGLIAVAGSPSVHRCTFRDNSATDGGGGVYVSAGVLRSYECAFENNAAFNGAAAYIASDATGLMFHNRFERCPLVAGTLRNLGTLLVEDCVFRNNRGLFQSQGGGLYNTGAALLVRSRFERNSVVLDGGAIYNPGGDLTAFSCVFVGNNGPQSAGAIASSFGATAVLNHCTFYQNLGGAVDCNASEATLDHCILWDDARDHGAEIQLFAGSTATVSHSDVQGGRDAVYVGDGVPELDIPADVLIWSADNFDKDPRLTRDGGLTPGSPCIDAGQPGVYGEYDADGEPRFAGAAVDVGADEYIDRDADQLADAWEMRHFGALTALPQQDNDGDTLTNEEEWRWFGVNPLGDVVYVDNAVGDDGFDGTTPGTAKGSIQGAIDVAADGDTIIVFPGTGTIAGPGNHHLISNGKSLVIKAQSPGTHIDLTQGQKLMFTSSLIDPLAMIGFSITGGGPANFSGGAALVSAANISFLDMTFANNVGLIGGGFNLSRCAAVLGDVVLENNAAQEGSAAWIRGSKVSLRGALDVVTGELQLESSALTGVGSIRLADDTYLVIEGNGTGADATILRVPVRGLGDIHVAAGQELRVEHGATIDLNGSTGLDGCDSITPANGWGRITVDGSLLVRGGVIQDCNIDVSLAGLEESTEILHNDITLQQVTPGFGGEFFVAGDSSIQCNVITSYGDRYLDLDPDPTADPRPTIQDNLFYVMIAQGMQSSQGELLELRSEDLDFSVNNGISGAYQVASSPGYDNTWALERLEILPDAKVNLTNRPGFVFQNPGIDTFEAIYVKDLVLHDGAVLNTGLQRLYYQTISMGSEAEIVDHPLLGFSLKVISMEDATEFDVRVRKRLQDPNDSQPSGCNGGSACLAGVVDRIPDPYRPSNSVMRMRTFDPGAPGPASSVAAHGAFARAGEAQIVVAFEYLFCSDATDELIVYLSDSPRISRNLLEIARIHPPGSGPGAPGSGAYATFQGVFPKGSLNFRRGTYIELELRGGADACVLIDEWDPLACGSPECGDYNLSYFLSNVDLLYGLTAIGDVVGATNSCLDQVSRDNYVDMNDIVLSDALYGNGIANLCGGAGSAASGGATHPVTVPPERLIVAGKPALGGNQSDRLYAIDVAAGTTVDSAAAPVAPGDPFYGQRGHGRLIRDGNGVMYQLHAVNGLVRLDDGRSIVAPGSQTVGDSIVRVGLPSNGAGLPMFDAAFDPLDPSIVYVVPVRIVPPEGEPFAYLAGARLTLTTDGQTGDVNWSIGSMQDLLGVDPLADPNNNTEPPQYSQTNVQFVREIEADAGGRVFITSARSDNANDWLLVYDASNGAETLRMRLSDLSPPISGPSGMLLTADGSRLLIGTALDQGGSTTVQEFALGGIAVSPTVTPLRVIDVAGMRFLSALAQDPASGDIWAMGFDAPVIDPGSAIFSDTDSFFTTPRLALIPATGTLSQSSPVGGAGPALPLAAAFSVDVQLCMPGDTNGDMTVTSADVPQLVVILLSGPQNGSDLCRADINGDGEVDGDDLPGIVALLIP